MPAYDDDYVGQIEVIGPSGSKFTVLTSEEAEYYTDKSERYQIQNKFTNISDLQDLDKVLAMELMCYRWGIWLSQEQDYIGAPLDLEALKKSMTDYSRELRLLKKSLGIDKTSRDRDKGEGVAQYLENLRLRAQEFGIMREEQCTAAITLFQELKSMVTLYLNCTPEERKQEDIEMDDVVKWMTDVAFPEFDRIDAYFREHSQKYWVRDM